MGDVIRLGANPGDEDSWWTAGGGTQEDAARASDPESAAILVPWERRTLAGPEETGALADLAESLWAIIQATGAADTAVTLAADALLGDAVEADDYADAAGTVALIQDVRRRLQVVEQYLTKRLGEAATETHVKGGTLPDGRQWEVRRGSVRKRWAHDDWKHDARAKVAALTIEDLGAHNPTVVDTHTGEEVADLAPLLIAAITAAQEVHGSTSPRVTQLRALGMDPDEYAETSPGLWGLAVASPDPTTTTEE